MSPGQEDIIIIIIIIIVIIIIIIIIIVFVLRYVHVPGGYYMHSGLLPAAMAIIYSLLLLILSYSLLFL